MEHDSRRVLQFNYVPEHLRSWCRRAWAVDGKRVRSHKYAIVGGAIIPVIQGAMADSIGIHQAFILPVICYLYIVFYALRGSKPNSERFTVFRET